MNMQGLFFDGIIKIDHEEDAAALRKLMPYGTPVEVIIRIGDDNQLRRRWFALLRFAFDFYEPAALPNGIVPLPNFNRFRKELTIMAGYYTQKYTPEGSVFVDAQSTAVGEMSAEDFADLYRKTNQLLIDRVLAAKGFDQATVDRAVDALLRY